MASGGSWASVLKSKPVVKKEQPKPEKRNIDYEDKGEKHIFANNYVLWCHSTSDNDWSINSYKKLCSISNVSQFWRLFNNFERLGINLSHFFLMKEGITPTWEDKNNRNGGICSFKVDTTNALRVWEYIGCMLVNDILTEDKEDITGISLNGRNNWAFIKIWNRNNSNNLMNTLNENILTHCKRYSMKYRANTPEY